MNKITTRQIFKNACELVVSSGKYVKSAHIASTKPSSDNKESFADLVTEYDRGTEKLLIGQLSRCYPAHKFIAEEMVADGGECNLTNEPTWIIDPIDGTTNFVHGFPAYCISVGLFVEKDPVLGIVYDIPNDKIYSAIKGEGAFCNGRVIKCSSTTDLNSSLIAAGFGPQRKTDFLKFKMGIMNTLVEKCHGIRCIGSAALDICHVAAGYIDANVQFGPHIWDFAAAHLIALEAGAVCSAPNGQPMNLLSRKLLVCSTDELRDQIVPLLGDFPLPHD